MGYALDVAGEQIINASHNGSADSDSTMESLDGVVHEIAATFEGLMSRPPFAAFTCRGPELNDEGVVFEMTDPSQQVCRVVLQASPPRYEIGVEFEQGDRSQGARIAHPFSTRQAVRSYIQETLVGEIKTVARVFGDETFRSLKSS